MSIRRLALAVALVAAAPAAFAATASDPMQVTISIENACTVAANDMGFGTQSTLATNIDSTATVVVTCTNTAGSYSVAFDNGGGSGATAASRKMTGPSSATINYAMWANPDRATGLLGNGTGTSTLGGSSNGAAQSFTIYGRVFGGQGAKPVGNYADTVTATLTY